MKKFAYIQHHGLPSRKAHSIYIVKSIEAAEKLCNQSYLVIPSFNKQSNTQIVAHYQLQNSKFKIVQLKCLDVREIACIPQWLRKHTWFLISSWIFAYKSYRWAQKNNIEIIQTGDREIILLLKMFRKKYSPKVIYDVHYDFSINRYDGMIEKKIISRVNLFVVNCKFLKRKFMYCGVIADKILVLPNGFDPSHYDRVSKNSSRIKYKFPKKKFIVGYIGQFQTLGIEKGIDKLIIAASKLKKDIPICVIAIGGPGDLVEKYQKLSKKLKLKTNEAIVKGYVLPAEVGEIITGFDVGALLYPPTGYFVEKMSPMKAVEYQAAKKPIIATDMPSIREILHDQAYYIKSYSVNSIVKTIKHIYDKKKYLRPYKYSNVASWHERQKYILDNV